MRAIRKFVVGKEFAFTDLIVRLYSGIIIIVTIIVFYAVCRCTTISLLFQFYVQRMWLCKITTLKCLNIFEWTVFQSCMYWVFFITLCTADKVHKKAENINDRRNSNRDRALQLMEKLKDQLQLHQFLQVILTILLKKIRPNCKLKCISKNCSWNLVIVSMKLCITYRLL